MLLRVFHLLLEFYDESLLTVNLHITRFHSSWFFRLKLDYEVCVKNMSYYNNGGAYQTGRKNEDDDRKLFVGALKWETSKEDLQQYFEQFGEVTYANVKTDPNSGKSRGFGFVTFADESSVIKVVQQKHEIDGKIVDAKRAKSRNMPDYGPVAKVSYELRPSIHLWS